MPNHAERPPGHAGFPVDGFPADGFPADEDPDEALSARERLRTGLVETPPKGNRGTRRTAGILLVLAFTGVPLLGILFLDSDGGVAVAAGLVLLAYATVLAYFMARTIRRR